MYLHIKLLYSWLTIIRDAIIHNKQYLTLETLLIEITTLTFFLLLFYNCFFSMSSISEYSFLVLCHDSRCPGSTATILRRFSCLFFLFNCFFSWEWVLLDCFGMFEFIFVEIFYVFDCLFLVDCSRVW